MDEKQLIDEKEQQPKKKHPLQKLFEEKQEWISGVEEMEPLKTNLFEGDKQTGYVKRLKATPLQPLFKSFLQNSCKEDFEKELTIQQKADLKKNFKDQFKRVYKKLFDSEVKGYTENDIFNACFIEIFTDLKSGEKVLLTSNSPIADHENGTKFNKYSKALTPDSISLSEKDVSQALLYRDGKPNPIMFLMQCFNYIPEAQFLFSVIAEVDPEFADKYLSSSVFKEVPENLDKSKKLVLDLIKKNWHEMPDPIKESIASYSVRKFSCIEAVNKKSIIYDDNKYDQEVQKNMALRSVFKSVSLVEYLEMDDLERAETKFPESYPLEILSGIKKRLSEIRVAENGINNIKALMYTVSPVLDEKINHVVKRLNFFSIAYGPAIKENEKRFLDVQIADYFLRKVLIQELINNGSLESSIADLNSPMKTLQGAEYLPTNDLLLFSTIGWLPSENIKSTIMKTVLDLSGKKAASDFLDYVCKELDTPQEASIKKDLIEKFSQMLEDHVGRGIRGGHKLLPEGYAELYIDSVKANIEVNDEINAKNNTEIDRLIENLLDRLDSEGKKGYKERYKERKEQIKTEIFAKVLIFPSEERYEKQKADTIFNILAPDHKEDLTIEQNLDKRVMQDWSKYKLPKIVELRENNKKNNEEKVKIINEVLRKVEIGRQSDLYDSSVMERLERRIKNEINPIIERIKGSQKKLVDEKSQDSREVNLLESYEDIKKTVSQLGLNSENVTIQKPKSTEEELKEKIRERAQRAKEFLGLKVVQDEKQASEVDNSEMDLKQVETQDEKEILDEKDEIENVSRHVGDRPVAKLPKIVGRELTLKEKLELRKHILDAAKLDVNELESSDEFGPEYDAKLKKAQKVLEQANKEYNLVRIEAGKLTKQEKLRDREERVVKSLMPYNKNQRHRRGDPVFNPFKESWLNDIDADIKDITNNFLFLKSEQKTKIAVQAVLQGNEKALELIASQTSLPNIDYNYKITKEDLELAGKFNKKLSDDLIGKTLQDVTINMMHANSNSQLGAKMAVLLTHSEGFINTKHPENVKGHLLDARYDKRAITNANGDTLVDRAVRQNDEKQLGDLIEQSKKNEFLNMDGKAVLDFPCMAKDEKGEITKITPIQRAVMLGFVDMAEQLFDAGVNPTLQDSKGRNALTEILRNHPVAIGDDKENLEKLAVKIVQKYPEAYTDKMYTTDIMPKFIDSRFGDEEKFSLQEVLGSSGLGQALNAALSQRVEQKSDVDLEQTDKMWEKVQSKWETKIKQEALQKAFSAMENEAKGDDKKFIEELKRKAIEELTKDYKQEAELENLISSTAEYYRSGLGEDYFDLDSSAKNKEKQLQKYIDKLTGINITEEDCKEFLDSNNKRVDQPSVASKSQSEFEEKHSEESVSTEKQSGKWQSRHVRSDSKDQNGGHSRFK